MLNEKNIQQAIDRRLSGLAASDARRNRIRAAVNAQRREERPVKKKFTLAIAVAIALMMMTGVAVAAGLGLFGQIAGFGPDIDKRLTDLDTASTYINKTFTVQNGAELTIEQAYYDGTRVFISWKMAGAADQVETGEGKPDAVNYSEKNENFIAAENYGFDDPKLQEALKTLDGSAPRWMHVQGVGGHDCLEALVDGEYVTLMIIGGDYILQPDGTKVGWKECEVPEELQSADELTVCFGTYTTDYTWYQDGTTLYEISNTSIRDTTEYWPFTVKKDDSSVKMTGSGGNDTWSATADVSLSKVELVGTITLKCPDRWTGEWDGWPMLEMNDETINDWKVFVNGEQMEGHNLNGSIRIVDDTTVEFGICFQHVDPTAEIELVPVYGCLTVKPEESIFLTLAP